MGAGRSKNANLNGLFVTSETQISNGINTINVNSVNVCYPIGSAPNQIVATQLSPNQIICNQFANRFNNLNNLNRLAYFHNLVRRNANLKQLIAQCCSTNIQRKYK